MHEVPHIHVWGWSGKTAGTCARCTHQKRTDTVGPCWQSGHSVDYGTAGSLIKYTIQGQFFVDVFMSCLEIFSCMVTICCFPIILLSCRWYLRGQLESQGWETLPWMTSPSFLVLVLVSLFTLVVCLILVCFIRIRLLFHTTHSSEFKIFPSLVSLTNSCCPSHFRRLYIWRRRMWLG